MDYDLLIKNGRVVDGSGLPSYVADVGIKDGKIAEIGRLHGTSARTIDADGFVVSPGFIDHHTHMDGQILWDPFGTCEPQHGVTSIIMGNCGLAGPRAAQHARRGAAAGQVPRGARRAAVGGALPRALWQNNV